MNTIERDIVSTLAFFQAIQQPLTIMELVRYKHGQKTTMYETIQALNSLQSLGFLCEKEGLYTLSGGQLYLDCRIQNDRARYGAWKRVSQLMKLIAYNPFVQAVAIANSLAFNNVSDKSDVDVFIVATHKRCWLARLLITLPAKLMKLRPGETQHAPLCLSFFVDENELSMQKFLMQNDIYFAHWSDSLVWFIDRPTIRNKFSDLNQWTRGILQRAMNTFFVPYHMKSDYRVSQKIFTFFLNYDCVESCVRFWQKKCMPSELVRKSNDRQSGVVVSETVMKMHLADKRTEIRDRYYAILNHTERVNVV